MPTQTSRSDLRLAAIAAVVKQAAPHPLGRTAIMKLVYFLQTLKDVPLGYDFRIYTFGPYDAQVLEDLRVAELKGAVKSRMISYAVGMGYSITPGAELETVIETGSVIRNYDDPIKSVIADFGDKSATELETASTLVFVDRIETLSGRNITISDAAKKVADIKPKLSMNSILAEAGRLKEKGFIRAI